MVLIIIVNTKYALHSLENFFLASHSLRRLRKIFSCFLQSAATQKNFFLLPAACGNSEKFFPASRSLRQLRKIFFLLPQLAATQKNFF